MPLKQGMMVNFLCQLHWTIDIALVCVCLYGYVWLTFEPVDKEKQMASLRLVESLNLLC